MKPAGIGGTTAVAIATLAAATGCGRDPATDAVTAAASVNSPSFAASTDWEIVFEDDFEAERLDTSTWNLCHWWDDGTGCQISRSGELQWYVPDQVRIDGGALVLTAEPTAERDRPYVSGMISSGPPDYQSAAKSAFTYGAVEARIRLPRGAGLWPAVWMLPESTESRPEIDIVEMYGDSPDVMRMHLHWLGADDDRESRGEYADGTDLTEGWHTVGVLWQRESIVWYLDGVEQWRVDGPQVPDEPMYVVINLAVGGERPGTPTADTEFPADMKVDWIRVWQPS